MSDNLAHSYEVEEFSGKVERTKYVHKNNTMTTVVKEEATGFMVYFPQGHSIRCKNKAELKKLGFEHTSEEVVDLDTGDTVPYGVLPQKGSQTIKERVINKTTNLKDTPTKSDRIKGDK